MRMRWAWHMACMGEVRNVYRVLVGKPEGKRPNERQRRRWEDGIRMDLRETGWGGVRVNSPGLGYGSLVGACECGDEPSGSGTMELVSQKMAIIHKSHHSHRKWTRTLQIEKNSEEIQS
jgi:hypothetical protein